MPALVESDPDLWTIVVPTWLAGLGGILSAVVAAFALRLSWKATKGVRNVAGAITSETMNVGEPSGWLVEATGHNAYVLRNRADHEVTLEGFDTISGDDDPVLYAVDLPTPIAALAAFPFRIQKSIVSATVTVVEATWTDNERRQSARYLI